MPTKPDIARRLAAALLRDPGCSCERARAVFGPLLNRSSDPASPVATIVDDHAPAVAATMRSAYAPLQAIIEHSASPEEALAACQKYLDHLPMAKRSTEIEKALQLAAAQGAVSVPAANPQPAIRNPK